MPAMSLEELLRSSLDNVNRDFQEADRALHAEVAAANEALSKSTGGVAQLRLSLRAEIQSETQYQLEVAPAGVSSPSVTLAGFRVGTDGLIKIQSANATWRDVEATQLREWFQEMASNPDSPLVQSVAFYVRQHKKKQG